MLFQRAVHDFGPDIRRVVRGNEDDVSDGSTKRQDGEYTRLKVGQLMLTNSRIAYIFSFLKRFSTGLATDRFSLKVVEH